MWRDVARLGDGFRPRERSFSPNCCWAPSVDSGAGLSPGAHGGKGVSIPPRWCPETPALGVGAQPLPQAPLGVRHRSDSLGGAARGEDTLCGVGTYSPESPESGHAAATVCC